MFPVFSQSHSSPQAPGLVHCVVVVITLLQVFHLHSVIVAGQQPILLLRSLLQPHGSDYEIQNPGSGDSYQHAKGSFDHRVVQIWEKAVTARGIRYVVAVDLRLVTGFILYLFTRRYTAGLVLAVPHNNRA